MNEWMPRGFRIPPYCNQSGMDRIRELHEQVKSLQAELDAARQHNSLYERALINIGNLSGDAFGIAEDAQIIAHNALLDVENKVINATRAGQEES